MEGVEVGGGVGWGGGAGMSCDTADFASVFSCSVIKQDGLPPSTCYSIPSVPHCVVTGLTDRNSLNTTPHHTTPLRAPNPPSVGKVSMAVCTKESGRGWGGGGRERKRGEGREKGRE